MESISFVNMVYGKATVPGHFSNGHEINPWLIFEMDVYTSRENSLVILIFIPFSLGVNYKGSKFGLLKREANRKAQKLLKLYLHSKGQGS